MATPHPEPHTSKKPSFVIHVISIIGFIVLVASLLGFSLYRSTLNHPQTAMAMEEMVTLEPTAHAEAVAYMVPLATPTSPLLTIPMVEQIHEDDIFSVAYVIACEAGLYRGDQGDELVMQHARDIAQNIRNRIESDKFPNSAYAVVSDRGNSQYHCYQDIRSGSLQTYFDIESALPLAEALHEGGDLGGPITTPAIQYALYYFAPGPYAVAPYSSDDAVSAETILANLDPICDANLVELTTMYAGHSPFNRMSQTTVFFVDFPRCFYKPSSSQR